MYRVSTMSQKIYYIGGTEKLTECTVSLTSGDMLSIPHCLKSGTREPCTSLFWNLGEHTLLTPAHPSSVPWPPQRYHLGCFSSSYSSHGYPYYFFILIIHSYSVPFYFFRALVPDFIITYWYICMYTCVSSTRKPWVPHNIYLPMTYPEHITNGTKGKKWMDYWINEYTHKQFWK